MASAGYATGFYCNSSNSFAGANEVDGIKEVSFDPQMADLDTTNFKDTSNGHTRIAGLLDCDVSCSGDWLPSDTPQALIRSQFFARSACWLKLVPDGTNGWSGSFLCTNFKVDPKVDGLNPFSAQFKLNAGTITVI